MLNPTKCSRRRFHGNGSSVSMNFHEPRPRVSGLTRSFLLRACSCAEETCLTRNWVALLRNRERLRLRHYACINASQCTGSNRNPSLTSQVFLSLRKKKKNYQSWFCSTRAKRSFTKAKLTLRRA